MINPPSVTKRKRAVIDGGLLLAVGIIAIVGYLFLKPSQSQKQAAASVQTTSKVENATTQVDNAVKAQNAAAAGGVAAVGQVNQQAPASPQKDAIAREIPAILAKMEPPDLKAQNESLARMNAVMQGKMELAESLYKDEAKKTAKQAEELKDARDKLQREQAERRSVDLQLSEAAAVGKFKDQIIMAVVAVAILLGAGWLYARMFSINMGTAGTILSDIRAGVAPTVAFDTHLAPWHHASVNKAARLATPSVDVSQSSPQ